MRHRASVTLSREDWDLILALLHAELDLLDDAGERVEDEVDSREWTKWSVLAQQYRQLLESVESQLGRGPLVTEDSQGWVMIRQLLEAEAGKRQVISLFGDSHEGSSRAESELDPLLERLRQSLEAQGWSSP
jgi:hypothetical protein